MLPAAATGCTPGQAHPVFAPAGMYQKFALVGQVIALLSLHAEFTSKFAGAGDVRNQPI